LEILIMSSRKSVFTLSLNWPQTSWTLSKFSMILSLAKVSVSVMPVLFNSSHCCAIESQGLNSSFWGTSQEKPPKEKENFRLAQEEKISEKSYDNL